MFPALGLAAEEKSPSEPTPEAIAVFETKVRPVLVANCYECHDADMQKNGLRLDSLGGMLTGGKLGPAIIPGNSKDSLLIRAVTHGEILQMPPMRKLPQPQINDIAAWIEMGAPWPNAKPIVNAPTEDGETFTLTKEMKSFWSFQKPVDPPPPPVKAQGWPTSDLDHFILAQLELKQLSPAPPADKQTLIRRVTFDLIGLPPTPQDIDAYLADESPQAFDRVIDRLLASPRYGERWGRHWLDVARYADSNGMDENMAYAEAYRYRDYVIAAFNKDKPYDQFVREQLAGDLLGGDPDHNAERLTATGFLSVGPKMLAEDDQMKMQMDIIDEQIDTVGRTFMGMTLGCARCHDHKFDPISTEDYYSLAGIFKSTKTMENFTVVAKWQERPLGTPDAIEHQFAQQKKIDDQRASVDQFTKKADKALLAEARSHTGAYLLAAARQSRLDDHLKQIKSLGEETTAKAAPGRILLEAEAFNRGNVQKLSSGYGQGIGVILNGGDLPNVAEYEVTVDTPGIHQVEFRYAAAEARPVKLIINGQLARSDAAGKTTGSWNPDTQGWQVEGLFEFKTGKNTIRLERTEPFPHIDKLLIAPADLPKDGALADAEVASAPADGYEPKAEIINQWAQYLEKTKGDPNSPLSIWHTLIAVQDRLPRTKQTAGSVASLFEEFLPPSAQQLADRYQQRFNEADAAWKSLKSTEAGKDAKALPDPAQEALRQILYDPEGPFALPKKPEPYYPADVAAELKTRQEQLASLEKAFVPLPDGMSVSDAKPENIRVHLRGSHFTLGKEVPRRFPQVMTGENLPPIDDSQSGRLPLANWLTSPDHPLTSRVMINRVWRWHFGTGLVRTLDNFGILGEPPTNQPLLDWLAVRFVQSGYSIKAMHRLIMLSSTYQMSTAYDARSAEIDPENKFYWRFNRHRLEAEPVRDTLLHLAGSLDQTMGGTLLPNKSHTYVTNTASRNPAIYNSNKRSVYLPVIRSSVYDVLQAFDFADPSAMNGNRKTTTVAPQALFMMNSDLAHEQTAHMATSLLTDPANADDAARVHAFYREALGRPPTAKETARALTFIQNAEAMPDLKDQPPDQRRQSAWQSLCKAIIASNEFIYVE
jgi:cytochrome c553